MKQGEEPLRSFGDLMQFFKKPEPAKTEPAKPEPAKPEPAKPEPTAEKPKLESEPSGDAQPSDSVIESSAEVTEKTAPSTEPPA